VPRRKRRFAPVRQRTHIDRVRVSGIRDAQFEKAAQTGHTGHRPMLGYRTMRIAPAQTGHVATGSLCQLRDGSVEGFTGQRRARFETLLR